MIIVNMHRIHTTCVFKIILANGFSEIYCYSLLHPIHGVLSLLLSLSLLNCLELQKFQ